MDVEISNREVPEKGCLERSIKHALRIGLLLTGSFFVLQPGMADTTNLDPVDVPPPPEFDPPDYVPPDYTLSPPDDPVEPGGGGGSWVPPEQVCSTLRISKPSNCPNPIPLPAGPYYGQDRMPGATMHAKSTILMAIAYAQGRAYGTNSVVAPDPTASWTMAKLLENQTARYTDPFVTTDQVNAEFRSGLIAVCNLETWRGSSGIRPPGGQTVAEAACFEIMKAFDQETNKIMTFTQFFVDWAKRYGVPLADYLPGPAISATDERNSITAKYNLIDADSKCSRWWTEYEVNQCDIY
jgi:hypothetical protein